MGDRRCAWSIRSFACAVALASALTEPARAQSEDRSATGTFPPAAGQARGATPSESIEESNAAQGIPPAAPVDHLGEPQENQDNLDGVEPVPRAGQRTLPVDGDLSTEQQPAPTVTQDGIVEVGEPVAPVDGGDAVSIDTRLLEDIALFENLPPPPDDDQLLFQIEDIDPVRDNRTTSRLARLEPYDPIGVRIGSFVLFPEIEVGALSNSNVFRSPDARSDVAVELRPAARLVSNWSRHAVELRGTAGYSYYEDFDTENDESYAVEARGRLDVSRRTNVQAIVSRDSALESRSAIDASAVGGRTEIETERAELALNHQFNRLTVKIRGSVSDLAYGDNVNAGVTTTNSDRDYTQTEQTVRATWEFKPTLSVFSEVAINQRDYDQAAQSDLINRSSDGQRYRVGLAFGNTSRILRGEISLGYAIQSTDAAALRDIDGLIIDANATWRISELTSVLFNARSDVTETTTANVGGALSRSVGFEVRHAFRRDIVASAGLSYTAQDSLDGVIEDKELRSTLGLEYFVGPEMALFGDYTHTDFESVDDSDYNADEVRVGVRLRR